MKVDEAAERTDVADGKKSVGQILESLKTIITLQRHLLRLSADINDEGANALMSDYIRAQEKQVWMYSAFPDQ